MMHVLLRTLTADADQTRLTKLLRRQLYRGVAKPTASESPNNSGEEYCTKPAIDTDDSSEDPSSSGGGPVAATDSESHFAGWKCVQRTRVVLHIRRNGKIAIHSNVIEVQPKEYSFYFPSESLVCGASV